MVWGTSQTWVLFLARLSTILVALVYCQQIVLFEKIVLLELIQSATTTTTIICEVQFLSNIVLWVISRLLLNIMVLKFVLLRPPHCTLLAGGPNIWN